MALEEKVYNLPASPGVYLFKNGREELIYIGKAKSLRHRVRSYFQDRPVDVKTEVMVSQIEDLEFIVTDTEVEALILESNLVKKNKPRFNVHLKDDKSFPYLKVTVHEAFPRVFIARKVRKDGALYFGPFLPASLARRTLKLINTHFLMRSCDLEIDGKLDRPCLDYHIKRCLGPCVEELCTREQYTQAVQEVVLFLQGKNEHLVRNLTDKMDAAAEREEYELAAFYRDRIATVRALAERQKMIMGSLNDVDFFAYHQEGPRLALQLFALRGSKLVGRREFFWEDLISFRPSEFLSSAIRQYYLQDAYVPNEIYTSDELEDRQLIEEWLSLRKGARVKVHVPQRGEKYQMLQLVKKNARLAFDSRFRVLRGEQEDLLRQLQGVLALPVLPRRIEAFDISNIQGSDSVASLVVCEDGEMVPAEYRRYRIRTVRGPDDFASMEEVVTRRYQRVLQEEAVLPDLVLLDGGKGQLSVAVHALEGLGLEELAVASIAKREETLFVKGKEDPIVLPLRSPILQLIQRIRDEAHRFAITYHRKRRRMRDLSSELEGIPGIGPKLKTRLLRSFGSLREVQGASVYELAQAVGWQKASEIARHFGSTAVLK
ncbi:MAG: excinuclease ABC subunit UvrC [Acidobacteria bacterium]|nr:excinuclease ABC subunit UvrC [Acidobacteriota bacterium]